MKAHCIDCNEFVPGINTYLYEAHDKLILCKACNTRRNNCCCFCHKLLTKTVDGFWSDYDKSKICWPCNNQRMEVIKHINDAFHEDFHVKLKDTITQDLPAVVITPIEQYEDRTKREPVEVKVEIWEAVPESLGKLDDMVSEKQKILKQKSDKHLKDAEKQVEDANKLLREAKDLNQKLRDMFKQ